MITAGMPLQTPGTTNMLKVHTVADICFSGQGIGTATAHGLVRIIETESDWNNLPEEVIVVVSSTNQAMIAHPDWASADLSSVRLQNSCFAFMPAISLHISL